MIRRQNLCHKKKLEKVQVFNYRRLSKQNTITNSHVYAHITKYLISYNKK